MSIPFFIIISLARSGSTAVFRAIELQTHRSIVYEPDFSQKWQSTSQLNSYLEELSTKHIGLKHVWDPNGWPFSNRAYVTTLSSLSRYKFWVEVNKSLIRNPIFERVLFLTRKNQLARIVSDLLGQQTNLWGHEAGVLHRGDEASDYRRALQKRTLQPLDVELIEWYVNNSLTLEKELHDSVSTEKKLVLYYEDLFDLNRNNKERLTYFSSALKELNIHIDPSEPQLLELFSSDAKLNNSDTLDRIPNIESITQRFGPIN